MIFILLLIGLISYLIYKLIKCLIDKNKTKKLKSKLNIINTTTKLIPDKNNIISGDDLTKTLKSDYTLTLEINPNISQKNKISISAVSQNMSLKNYFPNIIISDRKIKINNKISTLSNKNKNILLQIKKRNNIVTCSLDNITILVYKIKNIELYKNIKNIKLIVTNMNKNIITKMLLK